MNMHETTNLQTLDAELECAVGHAHGIGVSVADLYANIDDELPMVKRQALERLMLTNSEAQLWVDDWFQVRELLRLAYGASPTN